MHSNICGLICLIPTEISASLVSLFQNYTISQTERWSTSPESEWVQRNADQREDLSGDAHTRAPARLVFDSHAAA